jgi:hypothetical protein
MRKAAGPLHTHFSAMSAIAIFLVVLMLGTIWRLGAYRLASSNRPELRNLGTAMAFQY